MLILEMMWPNFKEGAYGVVFFTPDGRATKVFRRRDDANEAHVKNVFQSEIDAYQRATANPSLCILVPSFYGLSFVAKVINAAGSDISDQFYLCCAYQMQKIEGEFVKLGTLAKSMRQPVIDRFRSVGIHHTCDASAIVNEGEVTSVIDFATQEFVLEHSPL